MASVSRRTNRDTAPFPFMPPRGAEYMRDVRSYRRLVRRRGVPWQELGSRRALALFKAAAERVPAYKDFLRKQGVRAASVRTARDFAQVPPTTKNDYIAAYPLAARSWDGSVRGQSILAMSSGTSGAPTLWPRGADQEREAAFVHEFLFEELFDIDAYTTLMIVGFPMGIYVSGVATVIPSLAAAARHPNLSVAPASNNRDAVLSLVEASGSRYDQIVLVGHPFFIKDVLETGAARGIDWKKRRTRALSCSEGFNETWRAYVAGLIGRPPSDALFSVYGSSEFLLVGYENPYSIGIRQEAARNATLNRQLFSSAETPNLFQYNPLLRYIENDGDDLLITAHAGIPLVRFNQHDAGRVIPYDDVAAALKAAASQASPAHKGARQAPWRLPFVALSGRSDHTLVFYAANIYPEHISLALEHQDLIPQLTGKFTMRTRADRRQDQCLEIFIELRPGARAARQLERRITAHVVETLERVNMEYRYLREHLQKDLVPRIKLRPYQDPAYFKAGLKPRFIAV